MRMMKAFVDRALPIFPFEEDLYKRAGMDVRFVGHPLVDLVRPTQTRDELLRKAAPRRHCARAGLASGQPNQRARAGSPR
jgi:lipid-A-disaccharide synthase